MIYIATPTPNGTFTAAYVSTLMGLRSALDRKKFANGWLHISSSDIIMARNVLVNRALENPATTHVFFVDSDMQFGPDVLLRLLGLGRPLVGCIYPKRMLDHAEVEKHLAVGGRTLSDAIALASSYVVRRPRWGAGGTEGLCRAGGVGMGACLIQRSVFETMVAQKAVSEIRADEPYRAVGLKGPIWNFFALLTDKAGEQLSEDFSFCERWNRDCAGEVWAVTDAKIDHIGEMRYCASFKRHQELRSSIKTTYIPLSRISEQLRLEFTPNTKMKGRGWQRADNVSLRILSRFFVTGNCSPTAIISSADAVGLLLAIGHDSHTVRGLAKSCARHNASRSPDAREERTIGDE